MRIADIMTRDVKACRIEDCLNEAARIMWDHRCGCVPVLDENRKVAGMLTDRDICMAAYTQGKALWDLSVRSAMSKVVHVARAGDSIKTAEDIMKDNRIRPLPVLDAEGALVGLISLDDIAKAAQRQKEAMTRDLGEAEVGRTLAVVCDRTPAAGPGKPPARVKAPAS